MSINYYVDFINNTKSTWVMGVYQTLPDSPGLDSVSWKQTTVPQSGESGVTWETTYNVYLSDYKQEGARGVYRASQRFESQLGSIWRAIFLDGAQQLQSHGGTTPGQILMQNRSDRRANLGIGMDNSPALYQRDVLSNSDAQFLVTPKFWVGLFGSLQLGEVIRSNVVIGPFELVFQGGQNKATLIATEAGDTISTNISYSIAGSFNAADVARRAEQLAMLPAH